jgi:hypothetical protein
MINTYSAPAVLSTLGDLGVNLLAAMIGFVAARVLAWARYLRQTRNARRFWRPFLENGFTIVLSEFSEQFKDWERSGLIGVGDVKAYTTIQRKIATIREQEFTLVHASKLQGDQLAGNLVLLGGPDSNKWTREIMRRATLGVEVPPGTTMFRDRQGGRLYSAKRESSSTAGTDCGIVARVANPFGRGSRALILAGCFGEGTQAAASLVCGNDFEDHELIGSGVDFELLFVVEIIEGEPQRPTVKFHARGCYGCQCQAP